MKIILAVVLGFGMIAWAKDGAVEVLAGGSIQKGVEQARAEGKAHVVVHAGRYFGTSVSLTGADSGLVIEGAKGESAELVGGIRLEGWQKDGEHFWAAKLLAGQRRDVRMLMVNGEARPRARWPEKGELVHHSAFNVPWMSTTGGGWKRKPTHQELTTLIYDPKDIPADMDILGAEITVYHMWDESCVEVADVDRAKHLLTLSPEMGHPAGAFGVKKYVLWNLRKGLTRPGEWYFDRPGGRIVYWPLEREDMRQVEVIAPTTSTIIALKGTSEKPIQNVTIRNLKLTCTTVPLMAAGFGATRYPGAILLEQAKDCVVEGVKIGPVAGHGIAAHGNAGGMRVANCDVGPCGAGGIYVGGKGNVVDENQVHQIGVQYPSAIGIMAGGSQNVISHNNVRETSYSGINAGGEGVRVEFNEISRCMLALHDGAAIYMFAGKNASMRGNYAHDIGDTGGYGASAYYLDERSEDCVVEGNLAVNVGWPSHNHMAKHNTIRNNVFVNQGDIKLTFPRSSDYTLEENVLYATGKIRVENPAAVAVWSKNVFFSGQGVEGIGLKDYSKAGLSTGGWGDTRIERLPADVPMMEGKSQK